MLKLIHLFVLGIILVAGGCSGSIWNDPYPAGEGKQNIYYDSFSERPKHLDPLISYSSDEYTFIAQIYEPPLQYHFLKRPYQLAPLTATNVPQPRYLDAAGQPLPDTVPTEEVAYSDYRIHIRQGIEYQPHPAFARDKEGHYLYLGLRQEDLEGVHTLDDFPQKGTRELTAADYVYQIKRLAHPHLHSPIAGLMSGYIVGLSGLAKDLAAFDQTTTRDHKANGYIDLNDFDLEGARVIDRYTYEIRIKGKYPQFIYWLAMPFFAPMPWEAERFYTQPGLQERNITLDWYPVGTGPFMLTQNNPNLHMVMARNPNFHGEKYPLEGEAADRQLGLLEDAGKPLPFIDKAVFSLDKESIPTWNKFLQGYYDTSGISSDSFDQAIQFNTQGNAGLTKAMQKKGIELLTAVTTSSYYMGFNMLDPTVGGGSERARKLRQAISIAVDYEEFITIFQNGRGVAAQGPIPPGIFGSKGGQAGINHYVYTWVNGKPERKSVEAARRLLAEAGYPQGINSETGKPVVLYLDSVDRGPDTKPLNNWLIKQFNKLHIQLVIRGTDYNRFREKMRKGTAQIFQWGWNADYPDPENFLFLLYGPNAKVMHNGENAANYENPEYDILFNEMKNMENGPERQAVIDKMIELVRHDAPWLWGFHPKAFSLHHSWFHNAKPNLMANNTLKYIRIDPVLRHQMRIKWNAPVLWPLLVLFIILVVSVIPAVMTYLNRERSAAI
ncbi:MAG: ABC transporter substrate-binding protein [Gammaproteobacteria bacterium]